MLTEVQTRHEAAATSDEFYSRYEWCLNPILSIRELAARMTEELDRCESLSVPWQRAESAINMYLFACAIACTWDDYAAPARLPVARITRLLPRPLAGLAALGVQALSVGADARRRLTQREASAARLRWESTVATICSALARSSTLDRTACAAVRQGLDELKPVASHGPLAEARMRIPEAFRCQDLTHEDVLSMADLFDAGTSHRGPLAIVGLRTAGAYFAPLAAARLAIHGWRVIDTCSIRPKNGVSAGERRRLDKIRRSGARVLLLDDHQNTGRTLNLALSLLNGLGVDSKRITIVVPDHPARPRWTIEGANVIELPPQDRHKVALLNPESMRQTLQDVFEESGWDVTGVFEPPQIALRNAAFEQHFGDGFDVRLKRVYNVRLERSGECVVKTVVAKNAGWGWLGYHAFLTARNLDGYVPRLIGERNGILLTEWVDGRPCAASDNPSSVHKIASYVAARARRVPLTADTRATAVPSGWTVWDDVAEALSGVYGPRAGRVKRRALGAALMAHSSAVPTLVDGRMAPDEWIESAGHIWKTDFEQHNFGGGELNLSDPAHDLASAIFQFRLNAQAENELLTAYANESGDLAVADRIFIFKLLTGIVARKRSTDRIGRRPNDPRRHAWNEASLAARNFLVDQTNRYCGQSLGSFDPPFWSDRLFFLDLDGVLDWNHLGFPHTTHSGVRAISVLKRAGYSIVPNTARGAGDIDRYCEAYGFPGGVAELGSVFVDYVRGVRVPLISPESADQLERIRNAAMKEPGLFVDTGYTHSVRVYRYKAGGSTLGLHPREAEALLSKCRSSHIRFLTTASDTIFLQEGIDKGTGLEAVKEYLGLGSAPVIAMGDSQQDCAMLQKADIAYAPGNCSRAIRSLAARQGVRIMRQPLQNGLLAAARDLSRADVDVDAAGSLQCIPGLVGALLARVDSGPARRTLALLNWRGI
jgi:hydroxymethylpyrimidine pyrophosphatase-like HAD family hydrolase/hypoxanthine phosphoribosyltransferase